MTHEEHAERADDRLARAAVVQAAAATYFMGLAAGIVGRPLTLPELSAFATAEAQGYLRAIWSEGQLAHAGALRDVLAPGFEDELIVELGDGAACFADRRHAHLIREDLLRATLEGKVVRKLRMDDSPGRHHSRN